MSFGTLNLDPPVIWWSSFPRDGRRLSEPSSQARSAPARARGLAGLRLPGPHGGRSGCAVNGASTTLNVLRAPFAAPPLSYRWT